MRAKAQSMRVRAEEKVGAVREGRERGGVVLDCRGPMGHPCASNAVVHVRMHVRVHMHMPCFVCVNAPADSSHTGRRRQHDSLSASASRMALRGTTQTVPGPRYLLISPTSVNTAFEGGRARAHVRARARACACACLHMCSLDEC